MTRFFDLGRRLKQAALSPNNPNRAILKEAAEFVEEHYEKDVSKLLSEREDLKLKLKRMTQDKWDAIDRYNKLRNAIIQLGDDTRKETED